MVRKRIVVLANSYKNKARCVAGREVFSGGAQAIGGWIRPVSAAADGALEREHYVMDNQAPAAVLDIVDIPLDGHAGDPGQPENWRIREGEAWKKVGRFPLSDARKMLEQPRSLWLARGRNVDRVSTADQASIRPQSSLLLIRPEQFRLKLWRDYDSLENKTPAKSRAEFRYAGAAYSLSLTDPIFLERHCRGHPAFGKPPLIVVPSCGDYCLLCISLTPPYHGYHYKVVATVLELQ